MPILDETILYFAEFVPLPTTEPHTTTETSTTTQQLTTDTTTIMQTPDDLITPQTTTFGNDSIQTVNQDRAGGGSGNTRGDFVAIALGVLILIITVLAVAGIISAYKIRQSRSKRKKGKSLILCSIVTLCKHAVCP